MSTSTWRSGLCAALVALSMAAPARADIITFEDLLPTLFSNSTISSGGFDFTSLGLGFSGVDTDAAFAFPPANSTGQYLFGLNADVILMSQGGATFSLRGFDMSFVQPQVPFPPGVSAGQLIIAANTPGGFFVDAFDFGLSDANGSWGFSSVATDALYQSGATEVFFLACIYDGFGGCSDTDSLAQFAIDNISVPEPGSLLLLGLGLGLVAASRRRRVV